MGVRLIVGLGNPGPDYARTRHNVGFMVTDAFSHRHHIDIRNTGRKALYGEGRWRQDKLVLLKPQTYMNLSGEAVVQALHWYKITPKDMVVVYDDMDLETGRLRLRTAGSSGGQNGVKSIIAAVGTEEFARVRIGIGRPQPGWQTVDWVLSRFGESEQAQLTAAIERACDALEAILNDGFAKAMNRFNRDPEPPAPPATSSPQ